MQGTGNSVSSIHESFKPQFYLESRTESHSSLHLILSNCVNLCKSVSLEGHLEESMMGLCRKQTQSDPCTQEAEADGSL